MFEVSGIWESTQVVFDSFVIDKELLKEKIVIFMYRFLVRKRKIQWSKIENIFTMNWIE